MLRRSSRLADFRTTPKLADEFSASVSRMGNKAYDHVLIDVGPFASIGTRVVKGLTGNDRDMETSMFIQRQIFGVVLRKFAAAKSIALFFDGSDPLWKSHRSRVFPNKKFDDRFYRSCASPLAYITEERMRAPLADTARGRSIPEFTISGPTSAGPAEAKMSAYLNDLAARFVDPNGAAFTPAAAASSSSDATASSSTPSYMTVQPTDSVLIVGMDEAFLTALGALPFSNVTAVLMDGRDLKSLTMAEGMEWLTMDALGRSAAPGAAQQSQTLQQLKARVDAIILYLLGNGCGATDLPTAGLNFAELMSAYFDSQQVASGTAAGAYLCDLLAPTASSSSAADGTATASAKKTIGIDLVRLERVLAKAGRKVAPAGQGKEDPAAADYLELLLQTVAMFADGGLKNPAFVPRSPLFESPPQMKLEQLLGHIKFLNASGNATAASPNCVVAGSSPTGPAGAFPRVIVPSEAVGADKGFALTAAEQLLVSASLPAGKSTGDVTIEATSATDVPTVAGIAAMKAIHPSFTGGHVIPAKALDSVVQTANVRAAAEAAKDLLSYVDLSDPAGDGLGAHPALRHTPAYYYYSTKTVGPPAGYEYLPVNLGARSAEQQTRATFVAKASSQ